jgi:hypothetical protein
MRTMNAKPNLLHWATLLYAVVVIASLPITQGPGGGPPPAGMDPQLAMIVAQAGLILLPTLIFVWLTRQPPREILNLHPLDFWSGVKSFVLGLACWPIFVFLSTLTQGLMAVINPVPAGGSTAVASQGGSPWIGFLGVALVAPLCEELLFRGVLLSTYEKRFAAHAVWLVAILFAFLHPSFDQVLGALFVGTVAGWLVYRTRSIWSGVLAHVGINLVSALLALLISLAAPGTLEGAAQTGDLGAMVWIGALVWGVIGLAMLVPGFFLLRSIARRHPAPTWPDARLSFGALWSFAIVVIGTVGYTLYKLLRGVA